MYSLDEMYGERTAEIYFDNIKTINFDCENELVVDKYENGGLYLCAAKSYSLKPTNCVVYSFKVDYIWTFDDFIASNYKCTVRTFIPSMNNGYVVKRPSNVLFYNLGIGKYDEVLPEGWNFRRMSSLLKEFHEEYRVIDVLLIDIDFGEWDAFESMISDQLLFFVKQIIFESHTEEILNRKTDLKGFIRFLNIWKSLYNLGFRQWRYENQSLRYHNNIKYSDNQSCCSLHYLINLHYL